MRDMKRGISQADAADYVLDMFGAVRRTKSIGGLVKFHARNKYMIMAHDPTTLRELGRCWATGKTCRQSKCSRDTGRFSPRRYLAIRPFQDMPIR